MSPQLRAASWAATRTLLTVLALLGALWLATGGLEDTGQRVTITDVTP